MVCDEQEEKTLSGKWALAESIRQFGIELKRVDISDELRDTIISIQSRQGMINEQYLFKHLEATGKAYTDKQKM